MASVAATLSFTTQCCRLPDTKDSPSQSRPSVVAPGNYHQGLGEAASLAQQLPAPTKFLAAWSLRWVLWVRCLQD